MATPRKPVIGITGNMGEAGFTLATTYCDSIVRAGGVPVVLPPVVGLDKGDSQGQWSEDLEQWLEHIDALLLSGGGDINPILLGEEPVPELHSVCPERDDSELPLVRMAVRRQMPVLGICRGIQVMAAALGGSIYQDLYTQHDGKHIKHNQDMARQHASHTVTIVPVPKEDIDNNDNVDNIDNVERISLLKELYNGASTLAVNSFHHQAIATVPPGFRISAIAPDGIIEAMEQDLPTQHINCMGVQWHPECMAQGAPLFEWLVRRAALYKEARTIHHDTLTIDSHEDTPMLFDQGVNFNSIDPRALVTLPRMREGGLDCGFMVAYIPQGPLTDEGHGEAFTLANRLLDGIQQLGITIARTPDEALDCKRHRTPCVVMGVENGYAIGTNLDNIDHFAHRGCAYITLCHNGDNAICDSARLGSGVHPAPDAPNGGHLHGGLSPFGREVVARMNALGVMVDMSHAHERSFYDAIECSTKPIICSHSSARAVCNHPRNLTDDQLRTLAAHGGVAQLTLYHGFLSKADTADIEDAMRHLDHMVRIAGIEHVGIGTDFDGDGGIPGLANASELTNFTMALLARRYSHHDIAALWGGNLMRVWRSQ